MERERLDVERRESQSETGVVSVGFFEDYKTNLLANLNITYLGSDQLTMQNIHLPGSILASNLQPTSVHKVKDNTVGKFLDFNLGRIWQLEIAHMVPLDRFSLVLTQDSPGHRSSRALNRAENHKALAI